MSKTILCVLLKMLMLARADILSEYRDSDYIQNVPVSEDDDHILQNLRSDRSHSDNMSVGNKIDDISFANMSVIPESIKSILNKPTSPRAFVEFYNGFPNEKDDISVTFRWNQPEITDKIIQRYTVQCWFIENLKKIQICDDKNISATILEYTVHNLKPNAMYYFQVRAHTKVHAGPYTDLIDVSTTHENPIPKLLLVNGGIDIWDLDSNTSISLLTDRYVISAAYSIVEHKIYWSNENKDLMMLKMNKNNTIKIAKLEKIAYNLCIDWVTNNLYWMDYDSIIKFDLTMWENGIVKFNKTPRKTADSYASELNILPSMGFLYWKNYIVSSKQSQLIQSDLDEKTTQTFQKNLTIMCPFSLNFSSFFAIIDDINTKKPLIYWMSGKLFVVTDFYVSTCNLIFQIKKIDMYFGSFTIDKTNIYIFTFEYIAREGETGSYAYHIYVLKKKYALLESIDSFKYIQKINMPCCQVSEFYAFGKSMQPYPPTRCLTPDKKIYNIEILMITTNSIIVNLPELVPKSGCQRYNLPTTLYTINITYRLDNELNKSDNFIVQTYERYYEIQNLIPLTEYKLQLVTSNFYFDRLSMDPLFGSEVILRTKPELNAPENVTVETLTPTVAVVYWMPPKKQNKPVIYEIWTFDTNSMGEINNLFTKIIIKKPIYMGDGKFFTIIEHLIPEQKYMIHVRIYPVNFSDHYYDSLSKTLYMYSEPNDIILRKTNITSMIISWIPPVNLTNRKLEYRNVEMQKWQIVNNFDLNNRKEVMYYIKNLLPGTLYEFRLILRYPRYEKDFIWPSDRRFTFSTLTSDISSTPETLIIQYYLPITLSFVAIIIVICVCYFYYYRQRKKSNEQVLPPTMSDIKLETLHEIPNVLNVQLNTLYSPMLEYNSDKYTLIEIKREKIRLEKLLGSGAFGMNLERPDIEIPAAIKMLRKNASSQEKKKFLEEARLMNHFRHKHVLKLLAVCLDNDSSLIVLELMEIGDLLQYLRDSRKLQPSDSHALRMQDLFAMCEDVARGCCYLENLRFVHRDLACRNCLVSGRDRKNRIVKIGDFGLARNVSKNDYYRKMGQGLLPICWMAPESLVVGIFTSQSDVWSFGVLMWEITSLGEHPYTGRTNLEVIDYIRAGGRLLIPLNCPSTLYELMLRCWNPAKDRPNFNLCLENIIALRNNIKDTLLSPVDII